MDQMGWDEDTLIEWIDNGDGTHILKVLDESAT
jgi:hypothetical protein